jgi:hypothetical protein
MPYTHLSLRGFTQRSVRNHRNVSKYLARRKKKRGREASHRSLDIRVTFTATYIPLILNEISSITVLCKMEMNHAARIDAYNIKKT